MTQPNHRLVRSIAVRAVARATAHELEETIVRCQTMAIAARMLKRPEDERTARRVLAAAEERLEELRAKA